MLGIKASALAICLFWVSGLIAAQERPSSLRMDQPHGKSRKLTREWRLEFGGNTFSQGSDEGAAAEFHLGVRVILPFHTMFYGHFEPEADLYSGRVQERYDKDYYSNHLSMGSSFISFKPIKHFEVRAGSFKQDLLENPLLISRHRAFPGLQQIVSSVTLPVNVRFIAQQLIPTSFSLNTDRSEKEAMPSFQTQALAVDGKHHWVQWRGVLGHYNWSNLPTKVAAQSCAAGNETDRDCQAFPSFRYGFDGYFGLTEAVVGPIEGPVRIRLMFDRQANMRAPSTTRDAQKYGFGPIFNFGDLELELRWVSFFVERNSTVARYAPGENTNHMGNVFHAEADFKKLGFTIKGDYTVAPTIQEDPNQQTIREIRVGVETEYAPF